MIYITKNKLNYPIVTVSEKTTIPTPYYLMRLTSKDTLEDKILRLGPDESLNPVRYNMFEITESVVDDLDNGIINLNAGATYDYTIHQTPYATGNTENLLGEIVERGLLTVEGGEVNNTVINNNDTIKVFE